jgi:hypothetical protein
VDQIAKKFSINELKALGLGMNVLEQKVSRGLEQFNINCFEWLDSLKQFN